MRLDAFLVDRGEFESRNKAAEAIRAGRVSIGGRQVSKPSHKVGPEDEVAVAEGEDWVSRAAGKLAGYLREHPVAITGKTCLDIGSSTGGFSQVLLHQGAARVDAVDVGRDQLHLSLREDPRVRVYESTDIRDFKPESRYLIIVSDVSFISLSHILPSFARLAEEGAEVILLFKPQFEVGREAKRDRRGVVTDERAIVAAMERFEGETAALGWELLRKVPSTVTGKEGNLEWVYHFRL
ncbi:TlyA family RNA methyltransferase [Nitratifractor sp.]|uniref:23S rRNA (cytidine-2'-O)-methyltransferase TlyA n=1 Tax=Nitratifractor sp. TaxID=2268144 RepID=UPI0025DD97BA|nr:TlyA family RNA methyltransferase [Nitratifractor sp.]